jgi:hypothetical protein
MMPAISQPPLLMPVSPILRHCRHIDDAISLSFSFSWLISRFHFAITIFSYAISITPLLMAFAITFIFSFSPLAFAFTLSIILRH